MKIKFNFLYLLLIFAITTAIFYFGLSLVVEQDTSGWGGVVESIAYIILWGFIFFYYLLRRFLIWIFNRRNNFTDIQVVRRKSTRISLFFTAILLTFIVVWIFVLTGVIN